MISSSFTGEGVKLQEGRIVGKFLSKDLNLGVSGAFAF